MKCDRCQQVEATIHETVVRGGQKVEKHLCEACAKDEGIVTAPDLLPKLIVVSSGGEGTAKPAKPATSTSCPECGTTFGEFRQSGLLGCPSCYSAFEAALTPLLERAHEGGTHHVGKVPRRASTGVEAARVLGSREDRADRVRVLRAQLDAAVAAEEYERAARIRDELRRATTPPASDAGAGAA